MVNEKVNDVGELVTFAAYARHRGISPAAVSKAVSKGKLRQSIRMVDGQPRVALAAADAEWASTTRPRIFQGVQPVELRAAQRWGVARVAGGNVAVVLFNDAEAQHDREYEDQFVATAHVINELPQTVGPDGYPDVFVEMRADTARDLAAALLQKANE